eukprot:13496110-Alexandrium_andersonii.AAC.1
MQHRAGSHQARARTLQYACLGSLVRDVCMDLRCCVCPRRPPSISSPRSCTGVFVVLPSTRARSHAHAQCELNGMRSSQHAQHTTSQTSNSAMPLRCGAQLLVA